MPPCRQPARAAEHRTTTSEGITTTPVAVPGSHRIGSICSHEAPSHYTSERNTTSQHHSTTAPQHHSTTAPAGQCLSSRSGTTTSEG
ncbi:hypothetical protein KX522_07435 [Escherichia coli]|nr:hypothetical protein [Escherichia coli]MCD4326789.1 hypothetical protein [Escherichia coli]